MLMPGRHLVLVVPLMLAAGCNKKQDAAASPMEAQPVVTPTEEPAPEASAPEDEVRRVCTKLAELVMAEPDVPEVAKAEAADVETCVAEASKERAQNPDEFARQGECILSASKMQTAVECLIANDPGPYDAPPRDPALEARILLLCEKMLELAKGDENIPPRRSKSSRT